MKLSLIVRGQHPPGDTVAHLREDLDLVRCADRLGFDGIVKGSHFSAHPFQSVQQIPFLSYCAAIAPRLRIICGLVLVPLHKPLDLAEQLATGPGAKTPAELLTQKSPSKPGIPLREQFDELTNRIREVFKLARIARIEGSCGGYVHHNGASAVLLEVQGGNPELAKDICMHVAALRPSVVAKE